MMRYDPVCDYRGDTESVQRVPVCLSGLIHTYLCEAGPGRRRWWCGGRDAQARSGLPLLEGGDWRATRAAQARLGLGGQRLVQGEDRQ